MELSLAGKAAFITGGGSGINFGIAQLFVRAGASITICGRTIEKLEKAAEQLRELGGKVSIQAADVRDPTALEAAFSGSKADLGPTDIVIAGAAGNFLCDAGKLSYNGFKSVIDIDLLGSFNTCRAAFDQLKATRGSIIFISAGQGLQPFHGQAHAGAAKAGIENLSRNLAFEWGRYGIRSNTIVPGFIDGTEGASRIGEGDRLAKVIRHTPLGRLGSTSDIANAALFLSSEAASFITGASLVVDGGHYLGGSAVLDA